MCPGPGSSVRRGWAPARRPRGDRGPLGDRRRTGSDGEGASLPGYGHMTGRCRLTVLSGCLTGSFT
ncbi:hypothetical protein SXIM_05430 [Streptomyces xiamenensis]|uniref:Uncharacterized protein n=1 Tax=Streptomyces xiamenensis TaxID=408015 RepID=A0A0F7FPH8_9ACTN|nr:hypothetical protein SXIM_05430 [Streptomyces xiamenensis]